MPREIDRRDAAQRRSSKLLLAMGVVVLLGAAAYMGLTLLVNRRVPAHPDTHYTAENGLTVYYEGETWPLCGMTEDPALGHALRLASAEDASDPNYQIVLMQRGDKTTYPDYLARSEKDLKQAYGVISPRKVNLTVEGAAVTARRYDLQTYYGILATVEYPSGDTVYISALTKLASINDVVNLIEGVSLS